MNTIIVLLIVIGLIYFWLDSVKSKENAMAYAAKACRDVEVQLLDQTVSLTTLKLARSKQGRLAFQRIYRFDFSIHGNERREGRVMLKGHHIEQIQLDYDEGTVIENQVKAEGDEDVD
jgi:hypothetical protein